MSTYVMNCKIVFPQRHERKEIVLNFIESVRVESSWKLLTDTATITLPRKVIHSFFNRKNVREIFRRGDKVSIHLGYYDAQDEENKGLIKEFEGYITEVSADIPIKLKCEDEMWKLKAIPVNYSNRNVTLDKLLKDLLPGYDINANEGEQLGSVRFSETTVSQVLEKLQQEKSIYSYFKNGKLVSGKIYADDTAVPSHKFKLERNAVSNNLQYRRGDDVKVLIIARAIIKGQKIEFKIGEEGGDVYKLNYTGHEVIALDDLKRKAQTDYDTKKVDGFDGSFTAFGIPSVHHGERVDLESRLYTDRNGVYYIEGVNKTFSKEGYRQEIKLGGRVTV